MNPDSPRLISLPLIDQAPGSHALATETVTLRKIDDVLESDALATETVTLRKNQTPEFPGFTNVYEGIGEVEVEGGIDRRHFLTLSTAAAAALALSGCRRPELGILPYAQSPDAIVPGQAIFYATSMPRPGGCLPLIVECHEGRPTKIEGHSKHPLTSTDPDPKAYSTGTTDVFAQASILDLYSPDRSREPRFRGEGGFTPKTWSDFDDAAGSLFTALKEHSGNLHILVEDHPSPALRLLRKAMTEAYAEAVWYTHEPIDNSNMREGTRLAFGKPYQVHYRLDHALRILALDADFLGVDQEMVLHARGFMARRSPPEVRKRKRLASQPLPDTKVDAHNLAKDLNRLYVVENTYTVTGGMADHRLRLPASQIADYIILLARAVAAKTGAKLPDGIATAKTGIPAISPWLDVVAEDLASARGESVVMVGYRQPPIVHALAQFINEALGSLKEKDGPVELREWTEENKSLADLKKALAGGKVSTLVILGGNSVLTAPADLEFGKTMSEATCTVDVKVGEKTEKRTLPTTIIRAGLFFDETSEKATWHLPLSHYLESWGDAETSDGTYSIVQPMIAPLYGTRSALELLIQWTGWDKALSASDAKAKVFDLVKQSFGERTGKKDDASFKQFIHQGFAPGTARPTVKPPLKADGLSATLASFVPAVVSDESPEVSIHPSNTIYDGRFATNIWMMELPDPITKLSWDNAALLSPATARRLKVKQGDIIEIKAGKRTAKLPVFVQPGQADNSISVSLGYGKLRVSRANEGGGFDIYTLRSSEQLHFATAQVKATGERYELVVTQEHGTIPNEKREDILRDASLARYSIHPGPARHGETEFHEGHNEPGDNPFSRFQYGYGDKAKLGNRKLTEKERIGLDLSKPEKLTGEMQWGMVVDLNSCTGCNACMVACQSENNIPVVGKGEVKRNREMYWISIHRYFTTHYFYSGTEDEAPPIRETTEDEAEPRIVMQPMMCQHCERAPCESVCPVNASAHSPEGLNLQVYNRCIGTRYCSNNCPYKVRRFNWFDFNQRHLDKLRVPTFLGEVNAGSGDNPDSLSPKGVPETVKMQKNPEVTVRMRGVMEKCTYCIQRIEKAKVTAKVQAVKTHADRLNSPDTRPPEDPLQSMFTLRQNDGWKVVVPDGVLTTACAQACPSQAIVFGDVNDPHSRVYRLKQLEEEYLVLGMLNTAPRTSYLPRLRNLNPKMGDGT